MDDPLKLAYFAGLFDGEGCITIKRSDSAIMRDKRHKSPTYVLSIAINMTDPRPVQAMVAYFSMHGMMSTTWRARRVRPNEINWRPCYVAQMGRRQSIDILKALLPYLICKREEAILAIEFYERCYLSQNNLAAGRNRTRVPQWLLDLRHDYYLTLQALKRRSWPQENPEGTPNHQNDSAASHNR